MPQFESLRDQVGKLWQPGTEGSVKASEASTGSPPADLYGEGHLNGDGPLHGEGNLHGDGHVPPPNHEAALQLFSIYFGESEGAFGAAHSHEGEHRRNRGRDVLGAIDYLHAAKEAVEFAREGRELGAVEGPLSVGETLLAPLSIVNGLGEAMDGIDEYKEASRAGNEQARGRAAVSVVSGGAGAASGLLPLLGLPGGPVAGSFAAGVGIGKYGSRAVKEMGWLKDDEGKALTPSEWATQKGLAANELAQESHGMLGSEGRLAAAASVLGPMGMVMSPAAAHPGAATTMAASVAGAGLALAGAEIKVRRALAHLIGDSGPTDVMMHPDRYREVDGTPAQEAMTHLAKYAAPSRKERTP